MYFRESASLASSQPGLADEIERLDRLLFLNQDDSVRLIRIAAMLDIDDEKTDDLLGLFESLGVVTRVQLTICPACDAIIEQTIPIVECDLCEKQLDDR